MKDERYSIIDELFFKVNEIYAKYDDGKMNAYICTLKLKKACKEFLLKEIIKRAKK